MPALPTQQIKSLPDGDGLTEYDVPASQLAELIGAHANFDGSAAAAAFLPTLQVLAPDGSIMVQSVGGAVAAGGSAEVTFGAFLDAASSSSSVAPVQNSRYTATTTTVVKNTSAFLPFSALSFGSELLDRTVPTQPTVLADGEYQISVIFRVVIALGGAPTAGSGHAGIITGVGANQALGFFTYPSAAGTFVPQWGATTVVGTLTAGSTITVAIANGDNASNRVYDSPGIAVAFRPAA